jgi:hypothetical protein
MTKRNFTTIALAFLLLAAASPSPPAQAQTAAPPATGNITANSSDCSVAGSCVSLQLVPGATASVGLDVGGTWTGTLSFEGQFPNAPFRAISCAPPSSPSSGATTTTSSGGFQCNVAGMAVFRARGSATITGSAAISIQPTSAPSASLFQGGGGGGGGLEPPIPIADVGSAGLSGAAPIAINSAGVISAGGLGTVTGALKGNGSGTITQAACNDLSNAAASCSTDATNASNLASGTLPVGRIPAAIPIADVGSAGLSGAAPIAINSAGAISAGGLGTVTGALKGNGSGTITQAACSDLSNASPSCSTDATNASNLASGTLPVGRIPAAIPIADVGSAGLSGTAPISVSATGAVSCPSCAATTVITLASNYTNSTTSPTTVSDGTNSMSFSAAANTTYTMTCHLYYKAASGGGLVVQFTGPSSPTSMIYGVTQPYAYSGGTITIAQGTSTTYSDGGDGLAVTTANHVFDATLAFSLLNGSNSGTVSLEAQTAASGDTLTILAPSFCTVIP